MGAGVSRVIELEHAIVAGTFTRGLLHELLWYGCPITLLLALTSCATYVHIYIAGGVKTFPFFVVAILFCFLAVSLLCSSMFFADLMETFDLLSHLIVREGGPASEKASLQRDVEEVVWALAGNVQRFILAIEGCDDRTILTLAYLHCFVSSKLPDSDGP